MVCECTFVSTSMAIAIKLPLLGLLLQSIFWRSPLLGAMGDTVQILVRNKCTFPIWPATAPNTGHPVLSNGGFYLGSGHSSVIQAPSNWTGRIWARTACNLKAQQGSHVNQQPACQTGDCDGRFACNGLIGTPPATLVELTLHSDVSQPSYYDVSLVDGYNLPIYVTTRPNSNCSIGGCMKDLKAICPYELQVRNEEGNVVACKSACLAFKLDNFCCTNEFGSPQRCKPSLYSKLFKEICPSYFSYAFDSPTPLVNCLVNQIDITFCPSKWGHTLEEYEAL